MKIPPVLVVCAALFSGCAFFRPYDPLMAESFRGLGQRTKEVVAEGDSGRLSLAESRRFLRQSQAQMRLVSQRVKPSHLTADERTILASLDGEYDMLLRGKRPLRSSATAKLQNTLLALQTLRPVIDFSAEQDAAPDVDDLSDNDTTSDKKQCDCKDKHDREDRDCRDDHHR